MADRIGERVASLKAQGVDVEEARLPVDMDEMHAAHRVIMRVEAASWHDRMFLENQGAYAPEIHKNIASGFMVPAVHYVNALRFRARFIQKMESFFQKFDLVVLPAHVACAPMAEESTGNALFNEPFTQIGFPALTLPWAGARIICLSGFSWADADSARRHSLAPPAGARRSWAGCRSFRPGY